MVLYNGIEHVFGIGFQLAVKIPLIAHLPYVIEVIHCSFCVRVICKTYTEPIIDMVHILRLVYAAVKTCI